MQRAGAQDGDNGAVALYCHSLAQPAGGAERMICALATALTERGHIVHLISWDPPGSRSFYTIDARVTWHCLDRRGGLVDKLRRSLALARTLRNISAGSLIGFVMSGDKTVYAAALLSRTRLIAAERNAPSLYRIRYSIPTRILSMLLLHLTDAITVQSPGFVAGYPATLRRRIRVIPNPVFPPRAIARPAAPSGGRFTLLSVGRLDPLQKRPQLLLKAFARIASDHPDWDLRFIGDGPERARLESQATALNLADRVTISASTRDIEAAYATAHLFAMPSWWEGFPNALAEAMAHGLPAVGFRQAEGVADLIEEGDTGWLADGTDGEAALAAALAAAMGNDAERARRGTLAAQSMKAYGPDIQFDRWAALLRFRY